MNMAFWAENLGRSYPFPDSSTTGSGCDGVKLGDKSDRLSCKSMEIWWLWCETLWELNSCCSVFLLCRTAGAAPLLAWNRMMQSPNQYPPNQYQGLGGPMGYPQRPEDRMDRGRQVWRHCPILHVCLTPAESSFLRVWL